jgi:hypothetical protein
LTYKMCHAAIQIISGIIVMHLACLPESHASNGVL